MIRTAVAGTLALLIAFAVNAFAVEGRETRVSGTITFWGGDTPAPDFFEPLRNLIGGRLQVRLPLSRSHHWTASPAFGYGYGRWKVDQTAPPPDVSPRTDQLTASYWDTMLDFLYSSGCCDEMAFSLGPGLFYSSMKLAEKQTGMSDATSNPYRTIGAQFTLAGGIPMGRKLALVGSLTERAGWSSFDRKESLSFESKYSAVTHSMQFGCGLHVRF